MTNPLVTIRVWGDFACFTRPEMKVERVSYPVMTPSAARGIFEAIFWEPQIYYLIDSIHVIQRGRWVSLRRNVDRRDFLRGFHPGFRAVNADDIDDLHPKPPDRLVLILVKRSDRVEHSKFLLFFNRFKDLTYEEEIDDELELSDSE